MIKLQKGRAFELEEERLRGVDVDRNDPCGIVTQEVEDVVAARGDRKHMIAALNNQGSPIAFGVFPRLGEHQAAAIGRVVSHALAPRPTSPRN